MSNFFKKAAKGAGSATAAAIKTTLGSLLGEVVSEIIKETGVAETMKSQLVDIGVNAVKASGIGLKDVKKDFLKDMIMSEVKKMNK